MGNLQPSISTSTSLEHFSKRFIISGHPLDQQQSLMFYLHEKLSDHKYILRIISTNDYDEKQSIEDLICKKLAVNKNHKNTSTSLIPIDHYLFQYEKGYCNSLNKCYLLFDVKNSQPITYYLIRGHYNHSLTFNEDCIYKGLLNLIQGIALLKYYNHPHRYINCDTVYYDQFDKSFILADPWISPLKDTHEQYHAPQKLKQMKNQTQKHDPYIADLFSIGMVCLKILGHNNISQYYSVHKVLDQQGLLKLTSNIKNNNLKALLLKLLSEKTEVRAEVLKEIKMNSSSGRLASTESSLTKTRNLSGKVASVRRSFMTENRPTKTNKPQHQVQLPIQPFSTQQQSNIYVSPRLKTYEFNNNLNAYKKQYTPQRYPQPPFNNQNFYKKKQIPQYHQSQSQTSLHNFNSTTYPISFKIPPPHKNELNIKPQIDKGFNSARSCIGYQKLPQHMNFVPPINTPIYPFMVKQTSTTNFSQIPISKTIQTQSTNSLYLNYVPTHCIINTHNITTPIITNQVSANNYPTNATTNLPISSSEKALQSANSTVIASKTNQVPHFFTSLSQNGLLFSNDQKQSQPIQISIHKLNSIPSHITQANTNTQEISSKPPQAAVITQPTASNTVNQIERKTSKFVSPLCTQKQKIPPKTSPSYRSSQSFQSDHFYQHKIYQNLKLLQNKVSQAINFSRLNILPESQISNYSGLNFQNQQGKMIQSVIMPKQNQNSNSSHSNTVHALAEQLKNFDQQPQIKQVKSILTVKKVQDQHSQQCKQNGNKQPQNQSKKQTPKHEYKNDQNKIKNEEKPKQQDQNSNQHSNQSNNQQIVQLSVNELNESIKNKPQRKYQQQQKFEDIPTTPVKVSNAAMLEANNLTIPQESDEQSLDGETHKNKGEYVEQIYENGGKYYGFMLNGQRNGTGIFYYKDGGYYNGRWKKNMMNGYGKLYYQTGKLAFQGQWYQDEFHGRGKVYNDQPDEIQKEGFNYKNMNESQNCWQYYQGDLSHDMKTRFGKLMLSNGQYYEGQFKNDQVHGKGQFHQIDGTVIKGIWSQGIFIKQL